MKIVKAFLITFVFISLAFALVIAHPNFKPYSIPTGDEKIYGEVIPYSPGSRQSPGIIVGYTYYDWQRGGGQQGQRIAVDDSNQIHVNWMHCDGVYPGVPRFIKWNFRFPEGSWYGDAAAAPTVSGYSQIDVMIADPSHAKRTMNTWHYGGHSWTSIDLGSGWGSWPGDTGSPHVDDHIWPSACVASNNNIVMVTGNSGSGMNSLHLYLTTDEGKNWGHIADFDSSFTLGYFVRASRNPGSQKVVHAWTQSIAVEYAGYLISQLAEDVFYRVSTDNGLTWGPQINVTNNIPPGQMVNGDSTPWAYADVNAVFDNNDNLHLAWGANLGYMLNDTLHYGEHAKIFHWDEVSDTITVVSSPSIYYYEPCGWWLDVMGQGISPHTESFGLPADNAQLVVDPNGTLYCLWRGNDDTTDYSAAGYFNSEICAAYSTDNGLTWSDYVNLTNTRSPGAGPGDCFDEDCMTAFPHVINDSIFITYIEDKDAGFPLSEGTAWTDNPVRVWIFHKGLILGTEEQDTYRPEYTTHSLKIYPNPFKERTEIRYQVADNRLQIKIYDATGRLVKDFSLSTPYSIKPTSLSWHGDDDTGHKLPAGVYFVRLEIGYLAVLQKTIKIK